MELKEFIALVKKLENQDPKQMPDLIAQIKQGLQEFAAKENLDDLGNSIYKLCEHIMTLKDVKEDILEYLEHLIEEAITLSISKDFRVGFDALRCVFNTASEFYKTNRNDMSLKHPIGLNRPLSNYSPKIGEECDVVRPYITSTSFCGWTRCTVLEIQPGKYTLQYANTAAPLTARGEPWFAPLGTRMLDYDWRKSLDIGMPVQALLNRVWYKSTVVEKGIQNGSQRVRISYRRFADNGDREDSQGNKYFGLGPNEDEWIDVLSPRIQRDGKMCYKNLCYYTFNSEEILLDDNYDMLFEKEYEQKPFHAIMRIIQCKSSSLIRFINFFTMNGGFETVMKMMDSSDIAFDSTFIMISNCASIVQFIPRMDINRYLPQFHDRLYKFFRDQAKNLNPFRIDMAYYGIDQMGRRLYSLSEVHHHQNQLRKFLVAEFLQMNLEKKMLALRYMNDLINPKKPYTTEQRFDLDKFLKDQKIFSQIFQANTHEQILSRTHILLRYMIEKGIVTLKEFDYLWSVIPMTDQRGHATIEKLIADISKFIPIEFVELILEKLLNLNEKELTLDNLNLLRELKNREISDELQMRILSFLWDIIALKSLNIKTNIEEEVEKVFKVFVSGLKNPSIRMSVMDSMASRLTDAKKIKNQIDLLKDFIMSYPEKVTVCEQTDAPVTIYDALNFLKSKKIYETLLNILENTKNEATIREILNFLSFLFDYDFDDIGKILMPIYKKLGPTDKLLEWIYKILKRARTFVTEILENTTDFQPFQNLSKSGFEAIRDIILDINEEDKKIKIMKTYEYNSNSSAESSQKPGTQDQSTSTPGPVQGPVEKKDDKFIGPVLPETKKHLFVLVSPFKLTGMKFLNHLLHALKNSRVYDETVKLIIQFIVNLDESMEQNKQLYRKEFLGEICKQMETIVGKNESNDQVKQELQVYINLFVEIFCETEKDGLGDVTPHFEKIQGEKLNLNVENTFPRAKSTPLEKFSIVVDQNCTVWKFKIMIGQIIKDSPSNIDVIKFVNPIDDRFNGKSMSDMFFYDGENIKIAQKGVKVLPKHNLLNSDGTGLSQKFGSIVQKWFNDFKNQQGNLGYEQMKKLSDANWRGSLFRQEDRLKKMFEEHDKEKKGYIVLEDFKDFFYTKTTKNESAIWKIINLSGYKNNLKLAKQTEKQKQTPLNVSALPRRILSSPEIYSLIFRVFKNPLFKDVQLNFYRLLSLLEVSSEVEKQIEENIYDIISNSDCVYEFCYALEVANAALGKRGSFYYEFWRKNGVEKIIERINKILGMQASIYKLDLQLRNTVLPNLIKIMNMYASPMLSSNLKARFISNVRVNHTDLEETLKKLKDYKEDDSVVTELKYVEDKLRNIKPDFKLKEFGDTAMALFHNLVKNYTTDSSDFIPKLTGQIVRLMGLLVLSPDYQFEPLSLIYGIKNESMNYRRGISNIIYFYIQEHEDAAEIVLNDMLKDMPNENKHIYSNYFSLLARIIESYMQKFKQDNDKDEFFTFLCHDLLDKLFNQVDGESRSAIIGDKIIVGILMAVDILIQKPSICDGIKSRKHEIVEKCLFAFNIKEKIQALEVTEEMLMEPKQQLHFKDYVLCKTEQTRNAAFKIVSKLHEASKTEDHDFLQKYVLPVFSDLSDEIRVTPSKSLNVGLKNFGSTCYMNSMLQVLNSVEPFRNLLMEAEVDSNLVNQLKELFASLFYSERFDYAPRKLLEAFVPPINPGIQQDTTEFLNLLFDQVEAGLSKSGFKKLLDELFKGANTAQMICHSCGYKKENKEEFFSFGVQIDGKYDLASALQGSYQGEVISDYLCDNCQNRGETTKRNILSDIPSIMFIHLRRIVFNYDMFVNMKIHTRLQFPDELNIEPYTKEGVELREKMGLEYMKGLAHNQQEMKKFEEMALHGKEKDFYKLKLKGIIVHSGSADVGHYYSILPDGKSWHKFDDSRVTVFPMSAFENQCYGGTWTNEEWGGFGSSVNAYVLVYEKVLKNPIKIFKSIDGEEKETLIPYNEVKPFNTVQQYKAVWLDNHKFMVETHLLDENYSKGFLKFACNIMENSLDSDKISLISEILYTITYHSGHVGDMHKLFLKNIHQVQPEIFYNYVIKDKKKTFKLLFNQYRSVRDFMAQYMQIVIFETYRKGDEKAKKDAVDLIQEYIANMSGEVAKNWLRIDGYFKMLQLMLTSSVHFPELWDLFKSFNLISTLIDFVMEKASPVTIGPKNYSLGTKTNPVDFSNGLSILAFLVRHSYGLTGKNYQEPAVPSQLLFHLNDNDVICLSCMDFYRKMLKERQNGMALATIIQRLCILNLEFSKAIAEPILTAVCSITDTKDDLEDLCHIILEVLRIRDDYWVNRADLILGWCTPYIVDDNSVTGVETERLVYQSTIFEIFPVECLLNYAYLYRINGIPIFNLLGAIVKGCSVSEEAMKFLIVQPSLSYCFTTYLDWMKLFITNFLGFQTIDEKKRERIQKQIAETMKYVEDILAYREAHPELTIYKPLISGKICEKREVGRIEKEDIDVVINELDVYCLPSKPTGKGNESIDHLFDGSLNDKKISDQSPALKIMKKPAKGIALKMKPVEEDEDKQIVSLFDDYPDPAQTGVSVGTGKEEETNVIDENQPIILTDPNQPISMPSEKKEPEEPEKPEVIVDLEGVFVAPYFRSIQIFNKSKKTKMVKLIFKKKDNVNTLLPLEIDYKVTTKSNQKFTLAKQDYEKDWGDISIQVIEEDFDKEKHDTKITQTRNWFKLYGERSQISKVVEEEKKNVEKAPEVENPSPKEEEKPTNDVPSEISCPICTFMNLSIMAQCEMCGSNLH